MMRRITRWLADRRRRRERLHRAADLIDCWVEYRMTDAQPIGAKPDRAAKLDALAGPGRPMMALRTLLEEVLEEEREGRR